MPLLETNTLYNIKIFLVFFKKQKKRENQLHHLHLVSHLVDTQSLKSIFYILVI